MDQSSSPMPKPYLCVPKDLWTKLSTYLTIQDLNAVYATSKILKAQLFTPPPEQTSLSSFPFVCYILKSRTCVVVSPDLSISVMKGLMTFEEYRICNRKLHPRLTTPATDHKVEVNRDFQRNHPTDNPVRSTQKMFTPPLYEQLPTPDPKRRKTNKKFTLWDYQSYKKEKLSTDRTNALFSAITCLDWRDACHSDMPHTSIETEKGRVTISWKTAKGIDKFINLNRLILKFPCANKKTHLCAFNNRSLAKIKAQIHLLCAEQQQAKCACREFHNKFVEIFPRFPFL